MTTLNIIKANIFFAKDMFVTIYFYICQRCFAIVLCCVNYSIYNTLVYLILSNNAITDVVIK